MRTEASSRWLRPMRGSLSVAWLLASREWLADYRRSRVGVAWPVLYPLGYTALFALLRPMLGGSEGGMRYVVYVLVGFCLWQTWIDVLRAQLGAIRRNKALVSRGDIGAGTLGLVTCLSASIQLAPRIALMAIAAVTFAQADLPALARLLAFSLLILLNGSAIGMLLQSFATLSPNVERAVQGLSLALLVTGSVFLPMPADVPWAVEALLAMNPFGTLLEAARAPLFGEPTQRWMAVIVWSVVTLAGTLALPALARKLMPIVVERMGS